MLPETVHLIPLVKDIIEFWQLTRFHFQLYSHIVLLKDFVCRYQPVPEVGTETSVSKQSFHFPLFRLKYETLFLKPCLKQRNKRQVFHCRSLAGTAYTQLMLQRRRSSLKTGYPTLFSSAFKSMFCHLSFIFLSTSFSSALIFSSSSVSLHLTPFAVPVWVERHRVWTLFFSMR